LCILRQHEAVALSKHYGIAARVHRVDACGNRPVDVGSVSTVDDATNGRQRHTDRNIDE
jgi:hypothetical protein